MALAIPSSESKTFSWMGLEDIQVPGNEQIFP
jgi:hypothetical protein